MLHSKASYDDSKKCQTMIAIERKCRVMIR